MLNEVQQQIFRNANFYRNLSYSNILQKNLIKKK